MPATGHSSSTMGRYAIIVRAAARRRPVAWVTQGVGMMRRRRTDAQWQELLAEAVRQGWHANELHRRTGASARTVRKRARDFGIVLVRQALGLGIDWDAELAKALTDRETTAAAARRLNVSHVTVWRAAERRGIRLWPDVPPPRSPKAWEAEFRRAAEQGENQSALARRLGVTRQAVSLAAKRLNGSPQS